MGEDAGDQRVPTSIDQHGGEDNQQVAVPAQARGDKLTEQGEKENDQLGVADTDQKAISRCLALQAAVNMAGVEHHRLGA